MLTLYEHPLSPYAQKCTIALAEKSVPVEAKTPLGIGSGITDPVFLAASPHA